nr:leucine-rich repeat receptor protein kinase EMS1-like [Ipomoea trifida]
MEPALQALLAATGSFLFMTIIFAVIYALCKDPKKHTRRHHPPRARTAPAAELSSIESATFDPALTRIEIGELARVTRDFSPDLIIGDGSFGLVYRAKLASGVTVAVKKLAPDAFQGLREFHAEMETLGKIQHPNIVKMLGFCIAGSDRILIYEYVAKGSLDQWLYDMSSMGYDVAGTAKCPKLLDWETRIKIVQGVARGLAYMHTLYTPIIHRDIKASNILLDAEFGAHIADFGLARLMDRSHSHVSTQVAGTMGYMPPEYIYGCMMATTPGDVYSFGVLMLEIATGRRPNFPFAGGDGYEIRLVEWVTNMVSQKRYMEMIDPNLSRESLPENDVINYFAIATMCVSEDPKVRPTMSDVVGMLE